MQGRQDLAKFSEIMLGLAENYSQSLSPEGIALRFQALQGYPLEAVQQAAFKLLARRKYTSMPTVADFLAHLEGDNEEQQRLEAYHAFEEVLNIPCDVRGYPEPQALARLPAPARLSLRMLGERPSDWTLANLPFKRREFVEIYLHLARNPQKLAELTQGAPNRPALAQPPAGQEALNG